MGPRSVVNWRRGCGPAIQLSNRVCHHWTAPASKPNSRLKISLNAWQQPLKIVVMATPYLEFWHPIPSPSRSRPKTSGPNHSDAACVERPVTGATPAIIITGIRVQTCPLVRRVAPTERGSRTGKRFLWRRYRYRRRGRRFLGSRYCTAYCQEYGGQK